MNHHHLFRHADVVTGRLIWSNFAHLFAVSLMPFSTAWIAQTELAAIPSRFTQACLF
ncbi:TMEM175 family protein [Bradyrhizobium sp.]|uniref:TMEM175 family protein n=1 Tax=Bradyrhizobium sp. TaxID=376 RepID=UPI003C6EB70E